VAKLDEDIAKAQTEAMHAVIQQCRRSSGRGAQQRVVLIGSPQSQTGRCTC
jgi:hypothetical protein